MSSFFPWRTVVRLCALLACLPGAADAATRVSAQPGLASREITDFQLLDGRSGTAFNANGVYRTDDDGSTWTDITPPFNRELRSIGGAHFLDRNTGWVFTADVERGTTEVWRTGDGGRGWMLSAEPLPAIGSAMSVDFHDASIGFVLWRMPSGSNFSYGRLFRTTDGGQSWTELPPPPAAGRLVFVSPTTGWLQGGAGGNALFVTHDGGQHWREQQLPIATDAAAVVEMTVPQPVRAGFVTMHVALWNVDGSGAIHTIDIPTDDEDASPRTVSTLPVHAPDGIGTARLVAARGSIPIVGGDVVIADALVEPTGTIGRVENSGARMWALVHNSGCTSPNAGCHHFTSLGTYQQDAQQFRDITPAIAAARSPRVRADAVQQSTSAGFDKCAAASVSNMQTWKSSSPYSDANIYIGGISRSCSQPLLTSSWVSQVLGQNWRLIPTWVGPQSPSTQCSTCSNRFSTNATTARQQGISEANLAANAMAGLGLNAPSIVYYNLENYTTHTAAETQFVDGWSERLHQLGFKAGLYVNYAKAASYTSLPNALDGAWIARWWYGAFGSPAPPATIPSADSIPDLANSVFQNARIWQYYGVANQNWGGVPMEIDINTANGLVAVAGSGSQATINVNATNNGAPWSGQVNFNLNGPSGISGAAVPLTRSGSGGTYSVQYVGGGPSGGTFTGITPSSSQTVSTGGTITFTLNFTTPASCPDSYEPNNSSTQAFGPISAGSSYNGRICDASDVDWFGVDLTAGQTFNLSLAVPSSVDYDVELYGPNSAWATGSYSRGAGLDETFSYNAPSTGRYNVRIYGYQSAFRTDASYTLSFTLASAQQTLTVTRSGAGSGTVTSNPSGINCGTSCSANFAANTTVTLTASAASGSTFGGWSGSGCSGTSTCQVTMSQARSVTATFNVPTPGPQTLSVAKSGAGTGTVTSNPSGISCGATCSASFAYNTSVTLSASAGSGSTFAGWSGEGCSGTSTCQVTMSQARSVTATFNVPTPGPQTLSVTKNGAGTGTVTSNPSGITCGATCSASFGYNTAVTLSAAAGSGSTFAGWSGEGCSGTATCQVTMSQARSVTASFSSPSNPAPSISSVSPVAVMAGDPGFTLTVDGSGFIAASVVYWNGSPRSTSHVSSSRITALIAAADFTSPGTATVTVVNPTPGGGTSNSVGVTIQERTGSCPSTPIQGCPATVNRSLSASSCTGGKRGAEYYTDVLSFAATAGTSIVIDLSATFDTYLYLVDPNGVIVASNDDSNGTTNSQIAGTIQTGGTWTIEATSYIPGETGAYTLRLSGCGAPLATPTGLAVTYNHALVDPNTPGVDVRWNGVAGAVTYEADVNGTLFDLESSSTSVGFYGLAEPACYVIRIRAVGVSGDRSGWSGRELATSVVFSDDPLVPGVTIVKSAHAIELRTAVATVRSAAGLPAFSFSEAITTGARIHASHLIETRNALNDALTVLGRPPVLFSDPVPGVTTIRATDLQRLRDAMK